MSARPNMPDRRPLRAMSPATAFCSSLCHATDVKSTARSTEHRVPPSAASTTRAAGISGTVRRALSRSHTEPPGWAWAGNHTTAGSTGQSGTWGATVDSCSTPFCRTQTTVSAWHRAANHGAAASTCVDLTARKTRSTASSVCAGSIRTGPGTTTRPSASRSSRRSRAVRPHSIGVRPASCSAAATVVPIAPGPTTAAVAFIDVFVLSGRRSGHAPSKTRRVPGASR